MLKHIRKELIFNQTQLYIFAGYTVIFWIWVILQDIPAQLSLVFLAFVLPLFCAVSLQAREEKFKAWVVNCSLPTTRNTIILTRFLTSWMLIVAALVYGIVFTSIFQKNREFIYQIGNIKSILVFLLFASFFLAFLWPFTIRFGVSGVMIGLVAFQVLGVVVLVLSRAVSRENNILRSFIRSVADGIKFLLNHDPTLIYFLLIFLAAASVNLITLKFSQFLFARRDF